MLDAFFSPKVVGAAVRAARAWLQFCVAAHMQLPQCIYFQFLLF
jgi:hypothetical protein